jgi:hypothetical protein
MKRRNDSDSPNRASRRSFTKNVATMLVTAPLAASLGQAQTPAKPKEPPAPPNPQPSPAPPKPTPLGEAYAAVAQVRFGESVTPEEMTKIKEDLEGNVRTADRLRKAKLQNGDEPDFIFKA